MILVSRRSSFSHIHSPLTRPRSHSRASNVSPSSSPTFDANLSGRSHGGSCNTGVGVGGNGTRQMNTGIGRSSSTHPRERHTRGASATISRIWRTIFGDRSISNERSSTAQPKVGSDGHSAALSSHKEELEGDDDKFTRSASTEGLNKLRNDSVRSVESGSERGRSHSSTITRSSAAFI